MNEFRYDLDFTRTWGSMPSSFEHRVQYALRLTEEDKPVKKPVFRTIAIVIALLTIATAACAAALSKTVEVYGSMFSQEVTDKLEAGELAISGASHQVGDVVYTLDDAIFAEDGLYAAGTIKPAEGSNIVLIPMDYEVTDPAGYAIYNGEKAPEDAPSYRDLAESLGAKLISVWAMFDNEVDANNPDIGGSVGSECILVKDGSIIFATDFSPDEATVEDLRDGECEFNIDVLYAELTLDGEVVEGTKQWDTWTVTIIPEG